MFIKPGKTICLILTAAMVMTSALLLHAENGIYTAENSISAQEERVGETEILKGYNEEWAEFNINDWDYVYEPGSPYNGYVLTHYKGDKKRISIPYNTSDGTNPTDRIELCFHSSLRPANVTSFFPDCVEAVKISNDTGTRDTICIMDPAEIFSNSKVTYLDMNYPHLFGVNSSNPTFSGCNSLEEVHIKNIVFNSYTQAAQLFDGCTGLENVYFDGVDFNVDCTTATCMFRACTNLKTVWFKNTEFENVTVFSQMFSDCGKLKKVYLLTSSGLPDAINFDDMFDNCSSLERIYVNSGFLVNANIYLSGSYDDLFWGCSRLMGDKGAKCLGNDHANGINFFRIDDYPNASGYLSEYHENTDAFLEDWLYKVNGDYCDLTRYTGSEETVTIPQFAKVQGVKKTVRIDTTGKPSADRGFPIFYVRCKKARRSGSSTFEYRLSL